MTTRFAPHLVPQPADVDTGRPSVLLVALHPFLGWALGQHLGTTLGADVQDVTDADAAVRTLTDEPIDAVVIDLATADAAPVIARLRAARPDVAVVTLRADARSGARSLLAATAAVRHLAADADADQLVEALSTTLDQARALRAAGRRTVLRAVAPTLTLSPREQQVLELLRDGHSLPSVATTLDISMSTTKTYVARLYDKLESTSRTQVLLKALRLGLLQPEAQRAG